MALAGAALYLVFITHAFLAGWKLPTTAPILRFSIAARASDYEPFLHLLVFALATAAIAASWCARLGLKSAAVLRRDEILLNRFFRRWGAFPLIALCVFSVSSVWSGHLRNGDYESVSIVGLIPFSDAGGHFAAAHDQAKDGTWSVFALRRPLAAAFRSTLMFFGGFSYSGVLLLQATLLGLAAYASSLSVIAWRGTFAGLAFLAFAYVGVRCFLPTFLTEPLALIWALFAIPFLVSGVRDGSLGNALVGLGMMTIALFIRPSSMFTIPALCLWLVWRFGHSAAEKLRIGAYAAAVVFSVAMASTLLDKAYGLGSNVTGSNFSYTLCGLSIGASWSGCVQRYDQLREPITEQAKTDLAYRIALENIAADPTIMVMRLGEAVFAFLKELPATLWSGFMWGYDYPDLRTPLLVLATCGLVYLALRRREKNEIAFWGLLLAGIIASSAFVYFDDGRRVMATSYPLLWLFFACGYVSPPGQTRHVRLLPNLHRHGAIAMAIAAFLLFTIPAIAHLTWPARGVINIPSEPGERVVFGGRRITGVLVVDDDATFDPKIPTLRLSQFATIIQVSGVEDYQGLFGPEAPPLPFGFISTASITPGVASDYQYIVPPEVMVRADVEAWKIRTREWNRKDPWGPYWFYVDRADPVALSDVR